MSDMKCLTRHLAVFDGIVGIHLMIGDTDSLVSVTIREVRQ